MPRDVKVLFEPAVFSVKDVLEEERMIGNYSFDLLEGWICGGVNLQEA